MGTDRGQLLMIGQVGALENGWYQGPVGSGRNGWGDGIRSHRGKEVDADPTLERERGKWESGCARVELCQNWTLFIHRPQLFWESVQRGGKYIFTSCGPVNCNVKNISLYDCIDLCCLVAAKKGWKHGNMSHSHISRAYISVWEQINRVGYIYGRTTECLLGSRSRSVAHWIG